MADTSVPISPGSGANIDTRTESTNSNHRQVIVIGDPAVNAGVAPVDGTAGLKVDLGSDNDVEVTGSVTANAGTNLNTSALATSAKQDILIGHVDGIEAALTSTLPEYNATLPTYTDGQDSSLQTDDSGRLLTKNIQIDPDSGDAAALADVESMLGVTNETAPITDTASSGINGRLQRLAQHGTSLLAKDFATQTTLAALLAKVIAAPATEAKQDTIIGHLDGVEGSLTTLLGQTDGVEASLTSILAKIIAAPATEAKQDALIALVPAAKTAAGNFKVAVLEVGNDEYETVAASQTAQVLGATGATGDYLSHIVVQPLTTTPGVVTILDNAIEVFSFPGGASSVTTLHPFTIQFGAKSVSGAWKGTTGANVKFTAYGNFT